MNSNIEIVRYTSDNKKIWDDFVESSKNGTFLFNRAYMEYHSERFHDFSLLIYRKKKLYCLLPANLSDSSVPKENMESEGQTLFSHQGLTYGGLIMSFNCSAEGILEVFNSLISYLREKGIHKLIYKPIPHIYHAIPAEEDLYALFRCNARLIVRNISSTIERKIKIEFKKDRREAVRRCLRTGGYVKPTLDYDAFWKILVDNLKRTYNSSPVHSIEEIKKLASLFPNNIGLWGGYNKNHEMIGGVLLYYTPTCVHAQYISATTEGKKSGIVDLLISRILMAPKILPHEASHYNELKSEEEDLDIGCNPIWFDLGTSNEDGGRILNESLIYQKQGFGGRGVCYDTYELIL